MRLQNPKDIAKLLSNARYYEAEAKKPENADMKAQLLQSAKISRDTAMENALSNLQDKKSLAKEEAALRGAYRSMK